MFFFLQSSTGLFPQPLIFASSHARCCATAFLSWQQNPTRKLMQTKFTLGEDSCGIYLLLAGPNISPTPHWYFWITDLSSPRIFLGGVELIQCWSFAVQPVGLRLGRCLLGANVLQNTGAVIIASYWIGFFISCAAGSNKSRFSHKHQPLSKRATFNPFHNRFRRGVNLIVNFRNLDVEMQEHPLELTPAGPQWQWQQF